MKREGLERAALTKMSTSTRSLPNVLLQAEPEPLEIEAQRTAVMVIDVQNAFLSKGGFFDLGTQSTSLAWSSCDPTEKTRRISNIKRINEAARSRGIKVVYTASVTPSVNSLSNNLGPYSPYWRKTKVLALEREHPEWRNKLLIRGTWGADIITELKPQECDILVEKPRFSAFFQTNLDTILRTHDVRYLIFVGIATNICVEATIRDAYYRDYFCILVSDATINQGPAFTEEATIFNVKACFGWVTTTENIVKTMQ